jgi:hypothetical protein
MDAGLAAIVGTLAGVGLSQMITVLNDRVRQGREDRRYLLDIRRNQYAKFGGASAESLQTAHFMYSLIRRGVTAVDAEDAPADLPSACCVIWPKTRKILGKGIQKFESGLLGPERFKNLGVMGSVFFHFYSKGYFEGVEAEVHLRPLMSVDWPELGSSLEQDLSSFWNLARKDLGV